MKSLNRVTFIGHLANDVLLKQTPTGKNVAMFRIALNRYSVMGGEKRQVTDFHQVVVWGRLAEVCAEYLSKGVAVYLEGKLVNNSYEKDGVKHYNCDVVADLVNILTWKKSGIDSGSIGLDDVSGDNIKKSFKKKNGLVSIDSKSPKT